MVVISAIVLTKDEEKNIQGCLNSLQWCDELIVVDDDSKDKTVENVQIFKCSNIQNKLKIKIYKRHLNNDFAGQRNFGLEKAGKSFDTAQDKWILFIDADECVSPQLAVEIRDVTQKDSFNGFFLKRRDFLWGKELKHGETAKVRLLRLAKKGQGKWQRRVHEVWKIEGRVGELKNPISHYPHQTMSEFLDHLNFHSTLHAQALRKDGIKVSLLRVICNPLAKFIQNYFLRLGFLDGVPGLIAALMMSFHSFLARAKLYHQQWKK